MRPLHYINFMPFQQKWRIQVTISFWFSCTVLCYFNKMLYHVKYGVFQHSIYLHGLIWPSITDEDSIPETSVRSILSILCDFNKMAYHKLQCYPVFNTSTWLDLAKHHWWGFKTWNARPVHYIYFMRFQQKWRLWFVSVTVKYHNGINCKLCHLLTLLISPFLLQRLQMFSF